MSPHKILIVDDENSIRSLVRSYLEADDYRRLKAIARERGLNILGPNCLGVINTDPNVRMNASFGPGMPKSGSLGVISQSGALCTALLDYAAGCDIGFSRFISFGNKSDINEIDLLKWFARDESTRVVIGYLEDISAGDAFVQAAEEVASVKPIVMLKSGTTPTGLKAAASHTGVDGGVDSAYGAAFTRSGVVRADTFEALFDYAAALALQPLPKGDRVLIITNAGGPGIMAADAVEKAGMQVAILENRTITFLREKFLS